MKIGKIILLIIFVSFLFLLQNKTVLAQCDPTCPNNNTSRCTSALCSGCSICLFGQVTPPPGVNAPGYQTGGIAGGMAVFLNNIIKLLIVASGVYAVFNFVLAGYAFMSAGDDPKKIEGAWAKIWQTLIGLLFAVGAFVLAAVFGKLLFGDYNALLQLRVFGP